MRGHAALAVVEPLPGREVHHGGARGDAGVAHLRAQRRAQRGLWRGRAGRRAHAQGEQHGQRARPMGSPSCPRCPIECTSHGQGRQPTGPGEGTRQVGTGVGSQGKAARRPRSCSAAAASPAASTRSARCAPSTCCRSTARSTSSTSTSARAPARFVAALASNGVTPEEMMRVVNKHTPTPFRDIDLGTLLAPNVGEYIAKGAQLPREARSRWRARSAASSASSR